MQRPSLLLVLLLSLTLAIPIGSAEWAGRGFYEPDTKLDRDDGYMYADPDTATGGSQVYFSAYSAYFVAGNNPNLAATKSNHIPFPVSFHAFLGVWKDCNADGYIGVQEGALLDYRSELLLDSSICPAQSSPHNDGQWVQEFLWIGPDDPTRCAGEGTPEADPVDDDEYNIVDDCARVWGDFGLPTDEGATTCPLNPRPRGTYQSTGGLIRFVDCIANYRINDASVLLDDAQDLDESLGFQLGFGDAPKDRPDRSDSILNQKNPYGQPSGEPTFSVWDCSSGGSSVSDPTSGGMRRVGVNDPTGLVPDEMADPRGGGQDPIAFKNADGSLVAVNFTEDDGSLLRLHDARTPSVNPDGSPAGAVNDTLEGTPNVGFTSVQAPAIGLIFVNDDISVEGEDGDCDREEGIGETSDLYDLDEGDFEPSSPKRNDHDLFFNFRENAPRGLEDANHPLGESQPAVGGSGIGRDGALNSPLWTGAPGTTASRNGFVRIDDFNPRGAQYVTFYAYLDPGVIGTSALSLANGGVASTYGSDHCIGTSPTTGAWSCDTDEWWIGPQDEDIKTVWQVKVGQPYQLRDIDCYDQTLAEGVPTTTELVTGTSCDR